MTARNFIVDEGLSVDSTAVIDSSGKIVSGALSSVDSDSLSEGSSNLYHTTERVQDVVGGQLVTNGTHTGISFAYDDAGDGALDATVSLAGFDTGDLSEGSNLYYTDTRSRDAISVTDAGGDGSLAYNSTSGVITYTGPSASEVRAHFSAGTGVSISSGEISVGQAVGTSDNVSFGNLTLSGNLTVNGTTVTNSATNTTIEDALIELGSGNAGANSNDLGLILERGSTGDNAFIGWDESADKFIVGTTTDTGASTGDLTITTGTLVANIEGNVTGDLTGTADDADALSSAVTIQLSGDVSGSATFTNAGDTASITTTIQANSVALGTDTTGNYVATVSGTSNEIEVSGSGSESAGVTIGLPDDVTIGDALTVTGKGTTGFTTIGGTDGAFRNTFIHTAAPSSGDGQVGDIWITYS